MKTLLLLLLIAGGVALFVHDKQQAAALTAVKDQNAQMAQDLAEKQAALAAAQRTQSQWIPAATIVAPTAPASQPASSSGNSDANAWTFKDPGGLDRGAYKN